MDGLAKSMEKEPVEAKSTTNKAKGTRGDIDDEDDEESYYRYNLFSLLTKFNH